MTAHIARQEKIDGEAARIMVDEPMSGRECDILRLFKVCVAAGQLEDRIPMVAADTVVYEMAFKFGRADIVVFHIDGSASVIEAKEGGSGYHHVVAGIGQAGLYAAQLGMNKGALKKVRKCLLWTSTGDIECDRAIERACEESGTVALPWGKIGIHLAHATAAERVIRDMVQ